MTYVMADIHGNLVRFNSIMEQINLRPEDTLYVLGDVADRFPDGIRILDQIYRTSNIKMLLGNHDAMMLEALDEPPFAWGEPWDKDMFLRRWYRNGGEVTHDAVLGLSDTSREELFNYLKSLPLNIDITVNGTRFLLVHGGPIDILAHLENPKFTDPGIHAIWYRIKPEDPMPAGKTVIFGHTTTFNYHGEPRIWYGEQKICIDCGCGYEKGRLACLRLDDMKEFYSAN